MNFPALIFWLVIVCSFWARPSTVLVLLLASIPFASLSLLPPAITAGMTLLPQMMFAVVLILKVVAPHVVTLSPKFVSALQLRRLGFLALFLLVGIVSTLLMPRLFLGDVVILPMRVSWIPELLSPIQANFTQSGYVTLSVMIVFAVTFMADEPGFTKTLLAGLVIGGTVCVVTGLIDIAAAYTGMESLLEPFRNAQYAYLTNSEVGAGVRRVVGFTPEASAYGPICVEFAAAIALLRTIYAEGRQRMLATLVAISLVFLALLSTSSTAYGGLAVLGLVYSVNWIRRATLSSSLNQEGLIEELLVGLGILAALLLILVARAELLDPLFSVVDEVIFKKGATSSFYERSHWNDVAWDAVASTWGLGIGFGSTRTSNWFAAVISNAGVIGAALIGIFLIQTFLRRQVSQNLLSAEILSGLKWCLPPALMMMGVDSAGPDFGSWMAVVVGSITGIASLRPVRSSVGQVATDKLSRFGGRRAIGRRAFGRFPIPTPPRASGTDKPAQRPSF